MSFQGKGSSDFAVCVEGLFFSFDRKDPKPILDDLNLHVKKGEIYGLLGPSGCGKTTLLKCIVGQYRPSSGTMKVSGKDRGQKDMDILGSDVGFMPQDLALYPEMTAKETLTFYGRIYQMESFVIAQRISYLVELLEIQDKNKLAKYLSGGEKRRVSFALSLIHEPPLLILDEPTVGVDPLLRKKIWNHLQCLANENKITIIITTHYIEEARQADTVGLMRLGRLMIESNPETIIAGFAASSLEECFVSLCDGNARQETPQHLESTAPHATREWWSTKSTLHRDATMSSVVEKEVESLPEKRYDVDLCSVNDSDNCDTDTDRHQYVNVWKAACVRISALIIKNSLMLTRQYPIILAEVLVPVITLVLYCVTVGGEPYGLPLAIANMETDTNGFGIKFLKSLDSHVIVQKHYSSLSEAQKSVREGLTWGALYIDPHFTERLMERYLKGSTATNETIEESTIKLYLDFTSKQIASTLHSKLQDGFGNFTKLTLQKLLLNPQLLTSPIVQITYGPYAMSFADFTAPAKLLAIHYVTACATSAVFIITEKREGCFNRHIMAGVRPWEFIFSVFAIMLFIKMCVSAYMIIAVLLIVDCQWQGSVVWIAIASIFVALQGMSFGLFLATVCKKVQVSSVIVVFWHTVNGLIGETFCSYESLTWMARNIGYGLPLNLITRSVQLTTFRGWNITYGSVWQGYLPSILWTASALLLTSCFSKMET